MNKIVVVIVGIALLSLVAVSSAANITTSDASGVKKSEVTFTGNLLDMKGESYVICYFEWGFNGSGYACKTEDQNITSISAFTEDMKSPILFPGETYKYRAVGNFNGSIEVGNEKTFTLDTLDLIDDKDFSQYYDSIEFNNLSLTSFITPVTGIFIDRVGQMFVASMLFLVFISMFIRGSNMIIPGMVMMSLGGVIFAYLPADWLGTVVLLLVVGLAGMVYEFWKSRK